MNRFIQIVLFLGIAVSSNAVVASNFDGSRPLVCAIAEVMDCGMDNDCVSVDPESVNLPNIFRMNFKDKEMSNGDRKTAIEVVSAREGNTVLLGTSEDHNKAFSLLLSHTTGKFTGSVAADDYGFVLFGSCITD